MFWVLAELFLCVSRASDFISVSCGSLEVLGGVGMLSVMMFAVRDGSNLSQCGQCNGSMYEQQMNVRGQWGRCAEW